MHLYMACGTTAGAAKGYGPLLSGDACVQFRSQVCTSEEARVILYILAALRQGSGCQSVGTGNEQPGASPLMMEFHISRQARERYQFEETLFSYTGNVVFGNMAACRSFAHRMNTVREV